MIRKVGIYAGTFDPVHAGHVAFAVEAMRVFGLDEVVFLPEQSPRGKTGVTDIVHRVALLDCVVKAEPKFRSLMLGIPQFTVQETLPELQRLFAGKELVLLLGSDVARTFVYRWPGLSDLFRAVTLAIGVRRGDAADDLHKLLRQLQQTHQTPIAYKLINAPNAEVTSYTLRFSTTSPALHPAVAAYIKRHRLYR